MPESLTMRNAAAGLTAMAALQVVSGCMYETPDYIDATEAMVMLDEKTNPCSFDHDYKRRACDRMMDAPTMALVYPEGTGIDPKPVAQMLKQVARVATSGATKLQITIIPVTGELKDVMDSNDCVMDTKEENAGEMPVAQVAASDTEINEHDFVVALNTRRACDGATVGISYTVLGDRLVDLFEFPTESDGDDEDEVEVAYSTAAHEMAHSVFGLGHSQGDLVIKELNEYTEADSSGRVLKLDTIIGASAPYYEYGDENSIMGGGGLNLESPLKAEDMFTPMELLDINLLNPNVDSEYIDGQGKATLPVGNEGKYVHIDYDKDHLWEGENEHEDSYFGLQLFSSQNAYGEDLLYLYSNVSNYSEYRSAAQVCLGELKVADGETVTIELNDGAAPRHLKITRNEQAYDLEVRTP